MKTFDLGTLIVRYKSDRPGLKRELDGSEAEVKASGERMHKSMLQTAIDWAIRIARKWTDAGTQAGDGFVRSADGRLRDARGRFVAEGAALGNALAQGAGQGFRLFSTGLTDIASGMSALISKTADLKILLLAIAIAAAAVPLSYAAGGLLGAVPGLTTGGIAAISVLGMSFMGLGEAFKKTSASGSSVVDRVRQIMLAERRLSETQREVIASQLALNRAREQAAERLRDLTLSLNGARIDEKDATDAVARARRDLDRATEGDNPEQIAAATRALERAEQQLAEVQDRVGDLEKEQGEAFEAGVEGSDEVTAALERQRHATEAVEDATYELKRAQRPTGGGAADEATKIAASAMAAVTAIKALKDDFDELRLDVQQRFFAGTDKEIEQLWAAWEPTLKLRLGSMADMFNGVMKTWAATSKKPEFIANIAAGWEHVEKLIDRVGKAVAGPGLEAFGRLSRAAGPMIDALGEGLGGIVDHFASWIQEAEKSGELQRFFENAGKFFLDIVDIGEDAASIIGSILGILFKAEERHPETTSIDGFREAMDRLAKWFDDPDNQQKIADFFGKVEDFMFWVKDDAIPTVGHWIEKIDEWAGKIDEWAGKAKTFRDLVVGYVTSITDAITGMPGKISGAAAGMWDPIKGAFKSSLNWIINAWNNLEFKLPQATFLGVTIGGGPAIETPNIPALAGGGLVKATPGGRIVRMAEAGQDEIASPVNQMRQIFAEELARVQAEQGPTFIEIPIEIGGEVVRVIRYELTEHDRKAKRAATSGAGTR